MYTVYSHYLKNLSLQSYTETKKRGFKNPENTLKSQPNKKVLHKIAIIKHISSTPYPKFFLEHPV